jgi:hypothetical protein
VIDTISIPMTNGAVDLPTFFRLRLEAPAFLQRTIEHEFHVVVRPGEGDTQPVDIRFTTLPSFNGSVASFQMDWEVITSHLGTDDVPLIRDGIASAYEVVKQSFFQALTEEAKSLFS